MNEKLSTKLSYLVSGLLVLVVISYIVVSGMNNLAREMETRHESIPASIAHLLK